MTTNFKIAFRSFRNNQFFSLLNLSGLAVGMTACFLLLIYIQFETGYDQFHQDSDRIYQVNLTIKSGGDSGTTSNTPPPVGATLRDHLPEVESFTRHFMPGDKIVRREDRLFTESRIWAVDSNFLTFFTFPLLTGDAPTALLDQSSVVLTERMATKYFGGQSPMGREILLNDQPFVVTGVLENLPEQSSLQFDFLHPIGAEKRVAHFNWSWIWLQLDTHVKLARTLDQTGLAALEAKFPALVRQHAAKAFQRLGRNLDEFFEAGNRWDISLKPIETVHLHSEQIGTRVANLGSYTEVKIFGIVALLILLLACINFVNLSTARSMKRAKEVGVRKVLGSGRRELIRQFLVEAMTYSGLAAGFALAITQFALPAFGRLLDVPLTATDFFNGWTIWVFLLTIPLVGLLAGGYPALYLSSFKPIKALKSRFAGRGDGHHWVRNGLVVFQFAISIGLITATLIILQQIRFSQHDLGLSQENVLIIPNMEQLGEQAKTLQEALEKVPDVLQTTRSTDIPTGDFFGDFYEPLTDGQSNENNQAISLASYLVDDDFMETMAIELVAGRDFDEQYGTDHQSVILNEAAVRYIGWENPIGQFLRYEDRRFRVIGVMKDFHTHSFRNPIAQFALFHESSEHYQVDQSFLAVRMRPGSESTVIQEAKQLLATVDDGVPFNFTFLDDRYHNLYQSEARIGSILGVFTGLSIFVACLGLLGLIAYTVERRTKEIGVRKVLGASVSGIVYLLAGDYLKLIFVAFLITIPVSYYFMSDWLNNFTYRIELQWWMFMLAGVLAAFVALATIGWQSAKAATRNPIESLKVE